MQLLVMVLIFAEGAL